MEQPKDPNAVALGRKGGKVGGPIGGRAKTEAKVAASRENGKKGGRPTRYLIVAWGDNKRSFAMRRDAEMNWPLVRETIEHAFPNWDAIYTPLESIPLQPHGTPVVVSVYESPNTDGLGRVGALDQWVVVVR